MRAVRPEEAKGTFYLDHDWLTTLPLSPYFKVKASSNEINSVIKSAPSVLNA